MYKYWRSLFLLISLLLATLACNLSASAPTTLPIPTTPPATLPAETVPPPSVTAETTPECTAHASDLTLAASQTTPKIGEALVLTAVLSNVGTCGMLGLPQYTLHFSSGAPGPILEPNPPAPIVHSLGIGSGQSDIITYTLQVVGAGVLTINISASFEVHLGYPGPAFWSGDNSEPITITVQPLS